MVVAVTIVAPVSLTLLGLPTLWGVVTTITLIVLLIVRVLVTALPTTLASPWRKTLGVATLAFLFLFTSVVIGKLTDTSRNTAALTRPPQSPPTVSPHTMVGSGAKRMDAPTNRPLVLRVSTARAYPGAVAHLSISTSASTLVRVLVTFPGQQPSSYFDLTDRHGQLTLELRVPRHLSLHGGQGEAHIVLRAGGSQVRQVLRISAVPGSSGRRQRVHTASGQ